MEVSWIQILVLLNMTARAFSQTYGYTGQGLTTMPNIPANAVNIKIPYNNIETFPDDAFENFYQLDEISFGHNPLKEFPNFIPVGNTLSTINAVFIHLTHINETIFNELRVLRALRTCCSRLTSLPNVPGPGDSLQEIRVQNNQLPIFPPLYHYKALEILDLSDNPMTSVQDSDVDNLEKLRVLKLNSVPLPTLPYNPKALQNVEIIEVSSSNVSTIA